MKKIKNNVIALGLVAVMISMNSCATVFGGPITTYQKTKPVAGQPSRDIRVAALILDIVLGGIIGVGIDFATCAIYKPAPAAMPAQRK